MTIYHKYIHEVDPESSKGRYMGLRSLDDWEITYGLFWVERDYAGNEIGYTRVDIYDPEFNELQRQPIDGDIEVVEGYGYRFPGSRGFGGVELSKQEAAGALLEHFFLCGFWDEDVKPYIRKEVRKLREIKNSATS